MAIVKSFADIAPDGEPTVLPMCGYRKGRRDSFSLMEGMSVEDLIDFIREKSDSWTEGKKFAVYQISLKKNIRAESDYLELQCRLGILKDTFEPIKCWRCGCKNLFDYHQEYINSDLVEFRRYCSKCNSQAGYWSFGNWMP